MPICSRSLSKDKQWQRKRDPAFPSLGRPDFVTFEVKRWVDMEKIGASKSRGYRRVTMIATAIGAVAIGAFAIGVLAIGRLAIRHIAVERAKFKSLEIQDLSVTRLHVAEVTINDSIKLPDGANREIAS
jgi:hypothetical protein